MADTQEQPRWKLSDLMGRLSAALPTKHADEPAPAPVMVSVREEHEDERDVAAAVRVHSVWPQRSRGALWSLPAWSWLCCGASRV